jgi:hypothetical protein
LITLINPGKNPFVVKSSGVKSQSSGGSIIDGKIVNGKPAAEGQFPYQVFFVTQSIHSKLNLM